MLFYNKRTSLQNDGQCFKVFAWQHNAKSVGRVFAMCYLSSNKIENNSLQAVTYEIVENVNNNFKIWNLAERQKHNWASITKFQLIAFQ